MALAVLLTALLSSGFWSIRRRLTNIRPMPMHLSLQLGANARGTLTSLAPSFDVSPDGRWIVYTAVRDGARRLFLQDIPELAGKFISETEGATNPFFSPDGLWVGFASGKTLKKVSIGGGSHESGRQRISSIWSSKQALLR